MRAYWIEQLEQIMRPVLENGRKGLLTQNMPIENRGKLMAEHNSTHLQAIGRGLCHLSAAGLAGLGSLLGGRGQGLDSKSHLVRL